MQTYTQVFAGGGAANMWRLEVPGRYFVILSLPTNPVDVRFFYRGQELRLGNIKNWTTGPLAGLQVGPLPADENGVAFDRIEITPTAADTIAIGIGDGTVIYNRAAGTVSVNSPVLPDNADAQAAAGASTLLGVVARLQAWNGATFDRIMSATVNAVKTLCAQAFGTLGALAQVALGAVNALYMHERGYSPGANFASNTALAATTNETVFSPASNVNGAIVYFRQIYTQESTVNAGTSMSLLAKTSAPTTGIDGELILGTAALTLQVQSGESGKFAKSDGRRLIAAGKGLYFRNSGAGESAGLRAVDYTLL